MRMANTYGPRMALDDGRVVSNFVAQALTGQPMTIYGDGQQTRSFQYVSDLIEGARGHSPAPVASRAGPVAVMPEVTFLFACFTLLVLSTGLTFHCMSSAWPA